MASLNHLDQPEYSAGDIIKVVPFVYLELDDYHIYSPIFISTNSHDACLINCSSFLLLIFWCLYVIILPASHLRVTKYEDVSHII